MAASCTPGLLGVAPTNRKVCFRGIEILHVRSGKVVERWGEWDGVDLASQLGIIAPERESSGCEESR